MTKSWDPQRASEAYNIRHWGSDYFHIGANGHLHAHPQGLEGDTAIDLYELVDEVQAQGLSLPVLVRFGDILRHRVNSLYNAFAQAMVEHDYNGGYTAVYPIKVNQQHTVVEEIYQARDAGVGLEAGSKPELMVVMALSRPGATIVCNGYKDREYMRLALIGRQLGLNVYIVIEKLSELQLVLEEAEAMGVEPLLGLRIRLASIGAGKWQNTGGEKSKFGLTVSQAIEMVDTLKQHRLVDCLQLLHFHLGSQLANIHDIQKGMSEAARHYAELRQLGVPLVVVDVGGGLGIDYEGTRSRSDCSVNYSLQEYANKVVHTLYENCEEQGLPHPHIITESGRAMTAHHAVLITDVIDAERVPQLEQLPQLTDDDASIIHDLWQNLAELREGDKAALEAYHDAVHWMSEAQGMYVHGVLNMQQRALAEALYHTTCHAVRDGLNENSRQHRQVLEELNEKLADKYFCNFSLFQSLPDIWAIEQVFPIMPLHRLLEPPLRRAVLHDITCDSDGRIDHYVDSEGVEASLPLHPWQPGERYLLGFFLVGAYQEILGDMHNLFGDTDSVNVVCTADGGYRLTQAQQGDTVDSVLRFVSFEPRRLLEAYRDKLQHADMSPEQQRDNLVQLEAGLSGYTYLEQ